MARTVVLVGFLMMAGFIAMIMLNLSHAHSELDSVQNTAEVQAREIKGLSQAHNQLSADLREKSVSWGELAANVDKQKVMIEQQEQRIAIVSEQERKSRSELQQARSGLDELWRKVLETPTTTEASTDEKDLLDKRQEEEIMFLKSEISNLQDKVSEITETLEKRSEVLPTTPPVVTASQVRAPTEVPQAAAGSALRGQKAANSTWSAAVAEPQAEPLEPVGTEAFAHSETGETAETESAESSPGKASEEGAGSEMDPEGPRESAESEPDSKEEPSGANIKQVVWFKECGCTGMEIEAVNFLRGLIARLGPERVKTNQCSETCRWPAEVSEALQQISVQESTLLSKVSGPGLLVVVHAAYLGVCGMPESFLTALQDPVTRKELILVSRSMFETDRLEEDAATRCNMHFDAVWVPSAASEKAFQTSGVEEAKMKVLHEPLDTELFVCRDPASGETRQETHFGSTELDNFLSRRPRSSFVFLSAFKWEPRKNWESLLENFVKAFPSFYTPVTTPDGQQVNVSVRLLIKTQTLSWSTDPAQDVPYFLKSLGIDDPIMEGRLLVTDITLKTSDLPLLYKAADGFVLPSHGEGWGLPLIEAMASGLPTIGTGWGGQTDFMNDQNSWPIDYELVDSPTPPMRWAEPKAAELRKAMFEVVAGGPEVEDRTARACQEVHDHYTIDLLAAEAIKLFESLIPGVAEGPDRKSVV